MHVRKMAMALTLVVLSGAFAFNAQSVDGLPLGAAVPLPQVPEGQIIHDAEYYILETQHREAWAAEDADIDRRLAELRERNGGQPPNIVYILWDDQSYGDVGIPEISKGTLACFAACSKPCGNSCSGSRMLLS